jgi:AraC family transcriptional regulator
MLIAPNWSGDMYQQNPLSASRLSVVTNPVEPNREGGNADALDGTAVSLHQLSSLVAEIFRALNETLREERSNAEERMQRAAIMLEAVEARSSPAHLATPRGGLAPWQLRRVVGHIEANLETSIRNTDLATVARLSPFYFNVAFRKSIGDSPRGYIIRRRMERAQGLMLSTDASLSDIAATCGLADQAHFTRLFRRVVGETPGAWRRARANPRS